MREGETGISDRYQIFMKPNILQSISGPGFQSQLRGEIEGEEAAQALSLRFNINTLAGWQSQL